MSTTVTYKGETLTSVENATKTLLTEGKIMEGDLSITDVTQAPTLIPFALRPDVEKIKTYTYDKKLVADEVVSSLPSYSTTANAFLASSDIEAISITPADYDYWITMRFMTTPVYNTSTVAAGRNEYWFAAYNYEVLSIPANTIVTQGGKAYATRVTAVPQAGSFYRLFYWSSTSAVTVYSTAAYGWYMTVTAPGISSTTLTIKAPAFGVRGHTTYLKSAVWSTITDVRYQYVIEVWRSKKGDLNIDGWGTQQGTLQTISCAKSATGKLT